MVKIVNDSKKVVQVINNQLAELTPEARAEVIKASVTGIWLLGRWAIDAFADSVADRVASKIERRKGW